MAEYLGSQFLGDYPAEAANYYRRAAGIAQKTERRRHLAQQAFDVYYSLAVNLLQTGEAAAAEANFLKALGLRPDSAEAHGDAGTLLANQ